MMMLKKQLSIRILSFFTLLVAFSSPLYASPDLLRLDDFHPNCDIRQLNLSPEQHQALRLIRNQFKQAAEKAYRKAALANRNHRQTIIKLLATEAFDVNAARSYIENRYLSGMDFALDELEIQHRFFQILNMRQQQMWLNACLK